ncbi:MAG: hypothetical protein ACKVQV_03115 [Bacteroidia bacterium]
MKKLVLVLLFICIVFAKKTQAQEVERTLATKGIVDRVIEVPRMEMNKVLPVFKSNIKNIEGASFRGFCQSRNLVFITANQKVFDQVLQSLTEMGLTYYIKSDVTIERAMSACSSAQEVQQSLMID